MSKNVKQLNSQILFFIKKFLRSFISNMKLDADLESFNLGTKTRKQVAGEYGISVETLRRRLKIAKINIPAGIIFPKTLKIIYKTFGIPEKMKDIR